MVVKKESNDFIVRQFTYFLETGQIEIQVFYSNEGKFKYFIIDLFEICGEEIRSKDILIGVRNFLIGLKLDLNDVEVI